LNKPSVLLDGTQLLQKRGTGIASYTRTLARTLHFLGAEVNLLFGTNSRPRRDDPPFAFADQIFCHRPASTRLSRFASAASRTRFGLKRKIDAFKVCLDHIDFRALEPPLPEFDGAYNVEGPFDHARMLSAWGRPMATVMPPDDFAATHWTGPVPLKSANGPNIYTIHDLVPIQFPYFVVDRPGHSARLHAAIAQAADGIITVSETSKASIVDILKVPPERVTVTYQPVLAPRPLTQEDAEWIVSSIYNASPKGYALYLGAIEPKKNVARLIESFLLSRVNVPLLLVGPKGWLYDEEDELLTSIAEQFRLAKVLGQTSDRSSGILDRASLPVRHLGYLPRRHVTALLQCAKFVTFPSIYEGFGLPVLEAMQLGVPVLTSDAASLREVAGDAALRVDPLDMDDIARGIRQIDADKDLRAALTVKGRVQASRFSQQAYEDRLREAYRKVGIEFTNSPKKE